MQYLNLIVAIKYQGLNDIYDDFYSYCINDNSIDKVRFGTQVYNQCMKMLQSDYSNNKKIYNKKNLTLNDKIVIISFITLPLPIFNFSKINQEYTNIYNKSNLNNNFLNYYQLLNNETNINKYICQESDFDKFINTHNNIHNNTFLNHISNFSIETGEDNIFCSYSVAETTTSSPKRIDSFKL